MFNGQVILFVSYDERALICIDEVKWHHHRRHQHHHTIASATSSSQVKSEENSGHHQDEGEKTTRQQHNSSNDKKLFSSDDLNHCGKIRSTKRKLIFFACWLGCECYHQPTVHI